MPYFAQIKKSRKCFDFFVLHKKKRIDKKKGLLFEEEILIPFPLNNIVKKSWFFHFE